MSHLAIKFDLTGAGWMDIHFARDGEVRCIDGLSYLTPVLDDVVRAALDICTGAWRSDATFELEPGLRRLICLTEFDKQAWTYRTVLKALTSKRDVAMVQLPDDDFDLDWQIELGSADEFGAAVLGAARSIETRLGHEGYAAEWIEAPFPVRAVAALEAALGVDPLPPLTRD